MRSKRCGTSVGVVMSVALGLAILPGCGGGEPDQAPSADAGGDRTVQAFTAVQLDGSNSFDPEGDALTFSWVQIAGTAVSLNGADTPKPAFNAPDGETVMMFELTVADGSGQTDSDTVQVECHAPADDNQEPFADAGSDQFVDGGSAVQLDGTGSTDPDGDVLSFSWNQTGGPQVVLNGVATATPTFTTPNEDTTLIFELTVDDGRGGLARRETHVEVGFKPGILFVANHDGSSVTSFTDPATANGNIAPDTNLQGTQTKVVRPTDVAVTRDGHLLVANNGVPSRSVIATAESPASITAYGEAETTNGNLEPDGNVFGQATQLSKPASIALNDERGLLFVADLAAPGIRVYADAAVSETFNGNLAPIRVIHSTTSGHMASPVGINFGANDELYVADHDARQVLVYASASDTNGDVTPTRIIESLAFEDIWDVFIDESDTMYIVDGMNGGNEIHMFDNASSLNGAVAPDATLEVTTAAMMTSIVVDLAGNGYIADPLSNAVLSYDDIRSLNGALSPDRSIAGPNTQLDRPVRLFMYE